MAATAQPAQAPRHPAPGPYGGPPPEDPHQRARPFFYVQPAQPYLPYQWPVPYPPYCGFPGMGRYTKLVLCSISYQRVFNLNF